MTAPLVRLFRRLVPLGVAAALAGPGPAAIAAPTPAPDDLGQGLRYLRIVDLDTEGTAVDAALAGAIAVVDLRGARGSAAAAARFGATLRRRASPPHPVFVLLGADTPVELRAAVPATPAILAIGVPGSGPPLAVPVTVDPARDREACAAIAAGTPLLGLIEEKLAKRRFDEARLLRNHATTGDSVDRADPPEPKRPEAAPASPPPPPPIKDLVLQSAVFLHRAFIALGRLPEPPATPEPPPAKP